MKADRRGEYNEVAAMTQKRRKDGYRKAGYCGNCGGVRDRAPLLTCENCASASAAWRTKIMAALPDTVSKKDRRVRKRELKREYNRRARAREREIRARASRVLPAVQGLRFHQCFPSIPPPPLGSLAYQMAWHKRTEAA